MSVRKHYYSAWVRWPVKIVTAPLMGLAFAGLWIVEKVEDVADFVQECWL